MKGYNLDGFTIGKCLEKTKQAELEDFKYSFYRKLKLYGKQYTEKEYDELLEALHSKDTEEYHNCYTTLFRISLKYIRENYDLIVNLINSNNNKLITVAYDMYKKRGSIILRMLPTRATKEAVQKSDKKVLCDLEKLLLLVKSKDNNVIANAQLEFSKFYEEYSHNEYLSEYYKNIIDSFESELINTVNDEISKTNGIKKRLQENDSNRASFENREIFEKNKSKYISSMYKQTFR